LRWRSAAGSALALRVVERLKKGKLLGELGLGTREHRIDLSGLPAAPSPASKEQQMGGLVVQKVRGLVELTGRSLVGLDFSGARLSGWRLRNCEIRDCRFDAAGCEEWVLWNSSITDCSFARTNLRNTLLATFPEGKHNKWERVSFAGANLRHASAFGGVFNDCDFSDAKMNEAMFLESQLSRCRFAGRVEEVLFDGRKLPGRAAPVEMESVDFSDAQFVNVDFRGHRLRNVVLPRDEDLFLVRGFPCAGQKAIAALSGDPSIAARTASAVLENSLGGPALPPDSVWVFNRRDWREWGGNELLLVAERALRQAEADCNQ
jgi:uncharacterized protein YjbI with pentapeptide repeats